ncbi:MAG TPA: energy transducer TonB [Longimicrobiales bacterium]
MAGIEREGVGAVRGRVTANDRFKARYRGVLWWSVALAAVIHGGILWLSPVVGRIRPWLTRVDLLSLTPPQDVVPAPAPSVPPAAGIPVPAEVGTYALEEIPRPPEPLREPPPEVPLSDALRALLDGPTFTPYQVAPRLKNRDAVVDSLEQLFFTEGLEIPDRVRVQVWSLIDERGVVRRTLVKESSGFAALDDVVLRAAELMEFTPAWSSGRTVPVWISLPVVFQTGMTGPAVADTTGAGELVPRPDSALSSFFAVRPTAVRPVAS